MPYLIHEKNPHQIHYAESSEPAPIDFAGSAMKIRAPFTIEWQYRSRQKAYSLKPYRKYQRAIFGFVSDAAGHIVQSLLWSRGKMW